MEVHLTVGAIEKIRNGQVKSESDMVPVLQVMNLKPVQSSTQVRYTMMLSDGFELQIGMLSVTENNLVQGRILQDGSIIRLNSFICNKVKGRRIVIMMGLDVIETNFDVIGNPVPKGGKPSNDQPAADSVNNSNTTGSEQHDNSESSGSRQINNTDLGRSHAHVGQERQVHHHEATTLPPQIGQERQVFDHAATTLPPQIGQERQVFDHAATTSSHQVDQKRQVFGNGSTFPETAPSTRSYNNPPAVGHGVPREVHARDPPTTYSRQPAYQPQQRPPPMYGNRGPVARNVAPPSTIPINALSPYTQRWTIKARVTSKGELRHYNNQRGDGKVFNFDLLDADGGEIRVTCFNAVADQFFDQIVVGNLYLVSKGSLRPAQKNFNHLNHDYEIMLDNASTIQQCYEEDAAIPRHQFHFRSIGDIESMQSNSVIDVIGIVSSISPTGTIMKKNGTETQKRALQLKDMSGRSVEVTMWGNFCNAEGQMLQNLCDSGAFPVLAVKAGKISEFNGKAVSTIGSSQLFIDPDFVEAQRLKDWFEREGKSVPFISLSREFTGTGRVDVRKTITQIKDERLGTSEKPDWITVSATIIYMKFDNFCYTACPIMNGDRPCSKKVTDNGDGTWRCEKCDQCVDECDYRYILQLQLQDHTGATWVTAFQEAGEEIMGMPAKELYFVKHEDKDEEKFEDIIRRVAFTKYIFKLKIKEETYSDEQRVKSTVVRVDKLNYSSDTRAVLAAMDKLRSENASSLPGKQEGSRYSADAGNTGIGSSGIRDPSSVVPANQSGQFGNQFSGGGSYRGTSGSYGGGLPRQHVGNY